MMKRPQRNLTIIMTVLVGVYLLLTRLPPLAALALLGVLVLFLLGAAFFGRDLLIARWHSRRRRFDKALQRYERFEKALKRTNWNAWAIVLFPNIYSFDGIAVARNHVAQELIKMKDLDRAVVWLRAALQHDPLYPVPYVNFAVIAAMRDDANGAKREMTKAVQLGFNPISAQRILQRALSKGSGV